MFSLFGTKTKDAKTILVLDIGTDGIGTAAVRLNRNGSPVMLAEERSDIAPTDSRDVASVMLGVEKAFQDALGRLAASMVRLNTARAADAETIRPEHIAVYLKAPWSDLMLRNIKTETGGLFEVTPQVVERMIADYVQTEHHDNSEEEIIERSAVGIRLNGYAVDSIPASADVRSIELTVLSATAPKVFLKHLRSELHGLLGRLPVTFHPSSTALSLALGALNPQTPDYILCEISGEMTEMLVVLEKIPAGRATFPLGLNMINRTLMTHAGMAPEETASALRLAKEELSPMHGKISATLASAQKEYAQQFEKALRELTAAAGSAPTIRIVAREPAGSWIRDAVARSAWLQKSGTYVIELPDVMHIGEHIAGFLRADPVLALLAIFSDIRFDEHKTFNFELK